jgi:GT2 family glycosyltransferase
MLISVVVCTYRRAEELQRLLRCLEQQTYREFELLIIDGSGDNSVVRDCVGAYRMRAGSMLTPQLVSAPTGLTRQRNVGLAKAAGSVVCFLDDDVSVEPDFLACVYRIFNNPAFHDVGGLTGFDATFYPQPVTWDWRLRRLLGVVPDLIPGAIDHLGRRAPIEFAGTAEPYLQVGWLPGFCMIYRRSALGDLRFDEDLPTYAGEDKEFSLAVGAGSRLLLAVELQIVHHRSPTARDDEARRLYQVGFGMGRGFARRALSPRGILSALRYTMGESLIHSLRFLHRPSADRWRQIAAVPRGVLAGLRSLPRGPEWR